MVPPLISPDRAESYCTNGYVVLPGLVDPAPVLARVPRVALLVASPTHDPLAVTLSGVASSLLGLFGEPVRCFGTTFVVVPPGGPGALWHQDGYPWSTQLGITSAVTLRVALTPGPFLVIPGSHALPAQPLVTPGALFGA